MNKNGDELVRVVDNLAVNRLGEVFSLKNGSPRKLAPSVVRGYLKVSGRVSGIKKLLSVHRLVAMAFHSDSMYRGAVVRHLDGDKRNNRSSNLAWGTHKENSQDSVVSNRVAYGKRNASAKLDAWMVALARKMRACHSIRSLARAFGVSMSTMATALCGKGWSMVCVEAASPKRSFQRRFSDDAVSDFFSLRSLGFTGVEIAETFGASQAMVSLVLSGKYKSRKELVTK